MKRLAFCLFGISKLEVHNHWSKEYALKIDYRQSLENYRTFLINHFIKEGFTIDFFLSTCHSDIEAQLLKDYPAKKFTFVQIKPGQSNHIARNTHFINVLTLAKEYSQYNKFTYDNILITRFDIMFKHPMHLLRINYAKFNISYRCEHNPLIDDNFYIFHGKYLIQLINFLNELAPHLSYHKIYNRLSQRIKDINFMVDGNYWVNANPIYDLIRNKQPLVPITNNKQPQPQKTTIITTKIVNKIPTNQPITNMATKPIPPPMPLNNNFRKVTVPTQIKITNNIQTTFNFNDRRLNTTKIIVNANKTPGFNKPIIKNNVQKVNLTQRYSKRTVPLKIGVKNWIN